MSSQDDQLRAALGKIEKIDRAFSAGVKALSVVHLDQYRKMKQRRDEMVAIVRSKGYK